AVMREACASLGGDPSKINPQIPCDLVVDHSVIADEAGCAGALEANMALEYARNNERYAFLKWAQESFSNVRIVPPGKGICHQLNIENFSSVVFTNSRRLDAAASPDTDSSRVLGDSRTEVRVASANPRIFGIGETLADSSPTCDSSLTLRATCEDAETLPVVYFDTVVGTDSHTPTANGIGVLGWGVGGIEAEAAALGQPITTLVPRVVGVKLTGSLSAGVSAMDVSLAFAQMLRQKGVVGCFVECFGEGVSGLSATQRACISNMTPEYGSTCTLFPVDERTLEYLRLTGRSEQQVALVEAYSKAQGFWNDPEAPSRVYAEVIELDLSTLQPCLAGPSRPHDRIMLTDARERFRQICAERKLDSEKTVSVSLPANGREGCLAQEANTFELTHGAIAIAAVTSCTTATDPSMMIAAGLVARNAAEKGLESKPWVKTILAPGSRATERLLEKAGLMEGLSALGFHTCGFGCMSCIGNSGPILPALHEVAGEIELASILSGNRNFDGRISPDVSQNYLTAPANVIAYAIAGTMDIDMACEPLGYDPQGNPVYYADIAPDDMEVRSLVERYVTSELFEEGARGMFEGDEVWQALDVEASSVFAWDESSTYVRRPPYFEGMGRDANAYEPIENAIALGYFGDFITTDHISPAGSIAPQSPAARYLRECGVPEEEFNTYGSRRGNHEVLMRGTFANVKLQNKLADGRKGGWTRDLLSGEVATIFDASRHYAEADAPLVILAGKMYGSGSSRDWAAKGPNLLGVRAVLAESFERIHRSNLIGMGILPLQFVEGESAESLGLDGTERFFIGSVDFSRGLPQPATVNVKAVRTDGTKVEFQAVVRVDTPTEGRYCEHGGILQYVIRQLA
ncbi:MAG: aconitate hydratase, partial [Eggerthellaceae bacterium]|nr:aconitate hydratase [Eggerthellaceae bacterium]